LDEEMGDDGSEKDRYSFDEYRMYYESAERVTERRIATNRWNYSVCIALIVATSLLIVWSTNNQRFFVFSLAATVIFSMCGVFFCIYWLKEITAAKLLNAAKFEVLNSMAPNVMFENDAISYEPFRREWEKVIDNRGVRRVKKLEGRPALSSSGAELFLPRALELVFFLIGIAAITSALVALASPTARPYLPISPPMLTTPSPSVVPSASP